MQLVSPPRSEHARPPLICRLPQGATSDLHYVRTVEAACVLGKSKGGLVTLSESDPNQLIVFIDFLTVEETMLAEFCERSSSLRKYEAMLRRIGTEEPQSVMQWNHRLNRCETSTIGLDHVHVAVLGVFSPDDPPVHANTPPPVLSSPSVLTPLLPAASPSDQSLILELNVTSVASDFGHLPASPACRVPLFLRTFGIDHNFLKLGPSAGPTHPPAAGVTIVSATGDRAQRDTNSV